MGKAKNLLEQLKDTIGSKPPSVSFEFFPPKTYNAVDNLFAEVKKFENLSPSFVSVTYGAGGSTKKLTYDIVKGIKENTSLKPAAHLTCVGAPKDEIDAIARSYLDIGVNRIVALRGDPPAMKGKYEPHPQGYAYSSELITGLKKLGNFDISVAAFPEVHPEARSAKDDLNYLKEKIDCGADRAITQYCFDTDTILRFLENARKIGIKAPIVPGIVPISSFKQIVNFSQRCGASVPKWMYDLFDGTDDKPETIKSLSYLIAAEQCRLLLQEGVENFHFYTLNRYELVSEICHLIGIKEQNA